MNPRHFSLLTELIEQYVATGQPISSGYLAGVHSPRVSSATVRNALAWLEEEGYLEQPHTSAGRIPSEKGYRQYIGELGVDPIDKKIAHQCATHISTINRDTVKVLAQYIADCTGEMTYATFGRNETYITGFRYLVSKPEFFEQEVLVDISALIDHLDTVIGDMWSDTSGGVSIYIGPESGFGSACSTLVMRYTLDNTVCMLGILGPVRMNYAFNKALLENVYTIINT